MNHSSRERREKVSDNHPSLSIARQCRLLSVARSMHYYQPKKESDLNLELMKAIDAEHLKHPFKGVKRMAVWLNKDQGHQVNENHIYPYLLKNLKISRPNQVWGVDITYIPVKVGYLLSSIYH